MHLKLAIGGFRENALIVGYEAKMRFKIFLLLILFIFKSQSQTSKSIEIDSLINSSIIQKNFPGAQLYVKYNDSVLINKSYGYHTYDSINKVNNTHIYDLASLTKVLASTLSIMKLYDEKRLWKMEKLCNHGRGLVLLGWQLWSASSLLHPQRK